MAALDLGTAEADGVALAACAGVALSQEALDVEYDPWSTGSEVYGNLAGSLQIAGEADGAATAAQATLLFGAGLIGEADGAGAGTANPLTLSDLNASGAAPGVAAAAGQLGGSLQVAGEGDGRAAPGAPLSGGGTPTPLTASSTAAGSIVSGTIAAGNQIPAGETDGRTSASAITLSLGIGTASGSGSTSTAAALRLAIAMHAACAGTSAPEATLGNANDEIESTAAAGRSQAAAALALRSALTASAAGTATTTATLTKDALPAGDADGSAATAAVISTVRSLSGRSGPDGWEHPLIQGASAGASTTWAALSVQSQPNVELAGSA
jgi:hypothetical protein